MPPSARRWVVVRKPRLLGMRQPKYTKHISLSKDWVCVKSPPLHPQSCWGARIYCAQDAERKCGDNALSVFPPCNFPSCTTRGNYRLARNKIDLRGGSACTQTSLVTPRYAKHSTTPTRCKQRGRTEKKGLGELFLFERKTAKYNVRLNTRLVLR